MQIATVRHKLSHNFTRLTFACKSRRFQNLELTDRIVGSYSPKRAIQSPTMLLPRHCLTRWHRGSRPLGNASGFLLSQGCKVIVEREMSRFQLANEAVHSRLGASIRQLLRQSTYHAVVGGNWWTDLNC